MLSAFPAMARLSVETSMPHCADSACARSACATVANSRSGVRICCFKKACSRMPPILPAPKTATRRLERFVEISGILVHQDTRCGSPPALRIDSPHRKGWPELTSATALKFAKLLFFEPCIRARSETKYASLLGFTGCRVLPSAGGLGMKQNFAAMILGGTGQVGGAAVAELLAIPECREVVMVTRKPIAARPRVRNVVLDTGAADFAERTAALAREVLCQAPVSAVSCVGVGSGSARWSEEELQRLELGVVGAFARGCHDAGIAQFCLLSAVGSTARSRFRYARVMGMKEDTVRKAGFARLAIFRPGIIVGNAHTPAWVGWLGSLVPGSFGNIDQQILGRSIAAEIALHSPEAGEIVRENAAMKKLAAQFNCVTL